MKYRVTVLCRKNDELPTPTTTIINRGKKFKCENCGEELELINVTKIKDNPTHELRQVTELN